MNFPLKSILLILICVSTLALFYKLDQQYLWTDEVFSYHVAERIAETGESTLSSGNPYNRSPIYHRIVAYSMDLFSNDIWASRIVNIVFTAITSALIFFTTKEINHKNKNATNISFTAVLIYLTTNLTVALVRETRMYSMTSLLFTAIILAFYKAYIQSSKKYSVNILGSYINIPWAVLLICITILGIVNHKLTIILGSGIVLFLLIDLIINKTKINTLLLIIGLLALVVISQIIFGTVNPATLITTYMPDWSLSSPPIYYLVLLGRNIPWLIILSPMIIHGLWKTVWKDRNRSYLFITSALVGFLIVISLQTSKHERYLQPIIPILIISSISYTFNSIKSLNMKLHLVPVILLLSISLTSHMYLYQKELREINTYTPASISQHKKLDFNNTISYINQRLQDNPDVEIIADYHSAFTLIAYDIPVKKILVTEDHPELDRGNTDFYFGIPFVMYNEDLIYELEDNSKDILVVRDMEYKDPLHNGMYPIPEFKRPLLFLEN